MGARAAIVLASLLVGIVVGYTVNGVAQAFYTESRPAAPLQPYPGSGEAATAPVAVYGVVRIDGSSTVYPITEYIAERFMEEYPGVDVVVGVSGTGGGFKRFILGEIDINDASRRIKPSEAEAARANGVEWIEIPVAIDGIAVVVNPGNTWVECLTIDQLREIWRYGSSVDKWSDLNPSWPDEEIRLYGPGPDSGTFDYFNEAVLGEAGGSRTDYVASEDDNVLVEGVAGELYALGYFGLAYYVENRDKLKVVAIDAGEGCVEPTPENVSSFKYPLSRPLFIYVNREAFESRPEVRLFVLYYLEHAAEAAEAVGYVPFPDEYYRAAKALLEAGIYEGLLELAVLWAPAAGGES